MTKRRDGSIGPFAEDVRPLDGERTADDVSRMGTTRVPIQCGSLLGPINEITTRMPAATGIYHGNASLPSGV